MQTSDNQSRMPPSNEASREETIRGLYTELALHPTSDFAWGKGIENARALGYTRHGWSTCPLTYGNPRRRSAIPLALDRFIRVRLLLTSAAARERMCAWRRCWSAVGAALSAWM